MIIPEKVYLLVETRLRRRYSDKGTTERLMMARSAYYPASAPTNRLSVRQTRSTDRMAEQVQRILDAEQDAATEAAWQTVFRRLDRKYPRTTPEGGVAWLMYHEKHTQAEVCRTLSMDRQTVRRRVDTYIVHCALLAAAAGLIGDETFV